MLGTDTSRFGLWQDNTGKANIDVSDATRVTIDTAGNVGIATTTPGYLLDVAGTAQVRGVLLVGQDVTLFGKINKSIGGALVDQGGCYYAS